MKALHKLAFLFAASLPLALVPGCTSDNTSSTAQMIQCTDTGTGTTGCHPVTADDHAAGTCVDRDTDGDGTPHDVDVAEGSDGSGHASATGSLDDDNDGIPNADDPDDDNDGIADDRDCDSLPGGDNDHSGNGGGSGSGSGG